MRGQLRRLVRGVRDNKLVLGLLVAGLKVARSRGLLVSRSTYSHVPYRGIVTVECGRGERFLIKSYGHNIENGLFWEGLYGHEPESMRHWIKIARQSKVVLDVGANSGVFALSAAAVGVREVHAFEPLPRMYSILADNVVLNNNDAIKAWPYAVGAEDGVASIFDPGGDAPTSASLSAKFASSHLGDVEQIKVQVVSIDAFCLEQGIASVDLIKVDVEGYEEQALRGMKNTVAHSLPVILMEVLDGQEESLRRLVDQLWAGAFHWSAIDEGARHVSRNVLLMPVARRIDD